MQIESRPARQSCGFKCTVPPPINIGLCQPVSRQLDVFAKFGWPSLQALQTVLSALALFALLGLFRAVGVRIRDQ
jgi:hypothetical protein